MKTCAKCHGEFPATEEYFHKHEGYTDGFHGYCKKCKIEYDKNRYKVRKKELELKGIKGEMETLESELNKKAEEGYRKLISEPQDYGIGDKLHKINLVKGRTYNILQANDLRKTKFNEIFKGQLVYDNKEHVTLRHKNGYTESFRKYDILCGELKIKEV